MMHFDRFEAVRSHQAAETIRGTTFRGSGQVWPSQLGFVFPMVVLLRGANSSLAR